MADPFKNTATDLPSSKLTLDPDSDTKSSKILPLKLILKESDFISKPAMLELNKIMKSYG